MTEQTHSAKEAYFQAQDLLELTDDERDFPKGSSEIMEQALAESRAMPSGRGQSGNLLGLTHKERQAEFKTHSTRQRASARENNRQPVPAATAPEPITTKKSSRPRSRKGLPSNFDSHSGKQVRNVASSPILKTTKNQTPFYIEMGIAPRELKSGKNVKSANNIKLEPENRQLLRKKVIYFYPNDDISLARRTRIHKIIQLGAAWINRWRDDITHIVIDDNSFTYSQLLRHLNLAGIPKRVVLVNFDPYIPQCIQFGMLLDPNAERFVVKGAPKVAQTSQAPEPSHSTIAPHSSIQVRSSGYLSSDYYSHEPNLRMMDKALASGQEKSKLVSGRMEERVEDSFIIDSTPQLEQHLASDTADHNEDALSKAVLEIKAVSHLPLDEEEDGDSPAATPLDHSEGSETDEEPPEIKPKSNKKAVVVSKASALRDKNSLNLSAFQCMDPGTKSISSDNPNARTIQILEEMCKYYDQIQDTWRTLAYRKGIATLKKQTIKITSASQAAALPFIGSRLAQKIEEIVLTNRLRRLESARDDPLDAVLRLFLGVYGAGLVQANKWIQAGYRTLDDLNDKAKLSESQKIGIAHYNDFNSRIPRAEVEAHGTVVKVALEKIDKSCETTIMGSYRRGAKDSADIDMIVTKPGVNLATLRTIVLDKLVPLLYDQGFLKASLATSRSNDPTGSKWHGASCLPLSSVWRRMDFLLVPEEDMGAALLYFTGNDIFNRSMRLLARKKNMRLNQRGLYKDVQRGRRGEKLNEGILVEGRNEKKIFELLGVPWREPHERIC